MKLNATVLRDLFSRPPTRKNFRYVFLVESELLEDKILTAEYLAVGIATEAQKASFLQVLEDCQFSWMKDFYFIPNSKFGLVGEVKKELEGMGFTVLSSGWKIFHDKEDYFKINPEELAPALNEIYSKCEPSGRRPVRAAADGDQCSGIDDDGDRAYQLDR